MNKVVILILFFIFGITSTQGQTEEQKNIYKQAFEEQLQMIKGVKKIDFKRAVYLSENSFYEGKLNYEAFCNEISTTGNKL